MSRSGSIALLLSLFLAGACGTGFKDCDACPEMVIVPAGSFEMGSDERPEEGVVHTVSIAKPFAVGKFEVTFRQWETCIENGGCAEYRPSDEGWGRHGQPVVNVSWRYAQSYVWWLKRKTGRNYRLLSESEWEYVSRAGSKTRFWWGDEPGSGYANCQECGSAWDGKQAAPVGSFEPNAFGIYDTAGNVWEWVEDCHPNLGALHRAPGLGYDGAPVDGAPMLKGSACHLRVLRGGSWRNAPWHIRSANRSYAAQGYLNHSIGFRVACDLD